ncbi:hypothetical protein JCM13580A_62270 [Streptomyces drozdowiczii]|nr:hypothetical protein [Streptomyces sp. SID7803]
MPENTVTAPLVPMEPEDVAAAFAYIRARLVGDIDTAGAIADDTSPELLHRLLVDVAAHVFIPVTATDEYDRELCEHSFPGPRRTGCSARSGRSRWSGW